MWGWQGSVNAGLKLSTPRAPHFGCFKRGNGLLTHAAICSTQDAASCFDCELFEGRASCKQAGALRKGSVELRELGQEMLALCARFDSNPTACNYLQAGRKQCGSYLVTQKNRGVKIYAAMIRAGAGHG